MSKYIKSLKLQGSCWLVHQYTNIKIEISFGEAGGFCLCDVGLDGVGRGGGKEQVNYYVYLVCKTLHTQNYITWII